MKQKVGETRHSRRSRRLILQVCAPLLFAGLILVLTFYLSDAIQDRRLTKESVLHLFGFVSRTEAQNREDVSEIMKYLDFLFDKEIDPPDEFRDLFRPELLEEYGATRTLPPHVPPLPHNVLAGIDRFGTPYIYEVQLLAREQHKNSAYTNVYEIAVRSVGANRRDEGGAGDDYQRDVQIGMYHGQRDAAPAPPRGRSYYTLPRPSLSDPSSFAVFDDAAIGTFVGNVVAASGIEPPASFSIGAGSGAEVFSLTSEGDLYVASPIDPQVGSYTLTVDASRGDSISSFSITVYVLVPP